MAIRFRCTDCGKVLKAADEAAGRRVRCTGCGKVAVVPTPRPKTRPSVSAPQAAGPPGARPKQRAAEAESPASQKSPTPAHAHSAVADAEPEPEFELRHRGGEESELDMTPMVDVTFLLLIFFMITAAFTVQKAIDMPTPEDEEATSQTQSVEEVLDESDYVTVYVNSDNTYRVATSFWETERDAPSDQEMRVQLRLARGGPADGSGRPPNRLLVVASADARHDKVVTALDAGNSVGMEDIKLTNAETDQ